MLFSACFLHIFRNKRRQQQKPIPLGQYADAQQKMHSTKVQQPRLWFAKVSVSITKVGFVGTFLTTLSQCVDRSQGSVALLIVHV